MFLDINEIGDGEFSLDHALELPALTGAGDEPIPVGPTRLAGTLARGERGVDLHGRLESSVQLACGRCLEPFTARIRSDFFLTIVAAGSEFGVGEVELTEADAALFYATEGRLELRDVAAEQIYLNLPLKPICHDGCQGLCPHCGINRNREQCGCTTREIDPRLAPLLELQRDRSADS